MKFRIETQGCKVNQYESQQIREAMLSSGHFEAAAGEQAEITIINTCTVTHRSDADARGLIRKSLGSGRIMVTGCLVSTRQKELQKTFPSVEFEPKENIQNAIGTPLPRTIASFALRARAFVKIQDGCSNFCTYCIVPYARGGPSSRPVDEILSEINTLHTNGCNEAVLCGINIGLYEGGITAILKRILDETTMPRIRISSIEPWTVTDDFISLFSSQRICAHLHLPLQNGSRKILAAMGRPYEPSYFKTLIDKIIAIRPETAIGTDIMAGFPGEDEEDFLESLGFVEKLPLSYLHVFPYSMRSGTKAATLSGQVIEADKKRRCAILRTLSDSKKKSFLDRMTGAVSDVLVTSSANGICKGISSNYVSTIFKGKFNVGDIANVDFIEHNSRQMKGIACGQP